MIGIKAQNHFLEAETKKLAEKWGFLYKQVNDNLFQLELTEQHLQLIQTGDKAPGPIYVDFQAGANAHRRLYGGGKGQTIAKAVGLSKGTPPVIVDATAGLGGDAFVFAGLGAQVILIERHPIVAALLEDGLRRAAEDPLIRSIAENMHLFYADTLELLPQLEEKTKRAVDVIYLDPMFPHRKKSALVKKEMLAFQQLLGSDMDSSSLLNIARRIAKKRVVVKRPLKAPYLGELEPFMSMKMKKHRFDIYLPTAGG